MKFFSGRRKNSCWITLIQCYSTISVCELFLQAWVILIDWIWNCFVVSSRWMSIFTPPYKTLMICSFLLVQHHWTPVFHLWDLVCLWLLLCLPAIPGHSRALLQEAPWAGEWHCHCRQQLVHSVPALPPEGPDRLCWPLQHPAGPLHPYVCSVPGWIYVQTSRSQHQRQGGRKEGKIQITSCKKDLQFLSFQSSQLPYLGFWDPSCTFWILCALCSLGKCTFFLMCNVFETIHTCRSCLCVIDLESNWW